MSVGMLPGSVWKEFGPAGDALRAGGDAERFRGAGDGHPGGAEFVGDLLEGVFRVEVLGA